MEVSAQWDKVSNENRKWTGEGDQVHHGQRYDVYINKAIAIPFAFPFFFHSSYIHSPCKKTTSTPLSSLQTHITSTMVSSFNAARYVQAPSSELSETMASPASFKLLYFPILGLAGTSRDILSYAGAEFESIFPGVSPQYFVLKKTGSM